MRILMCYNKTAFTPGRYLEDGLRQIGAPVDVYDTQVDFSQIDLEGYGAALFVDSPARVPTEIKGIDRVKIPKLLWIHHGANALTRNLELCEQVRPDLVLMAHSLELAPRFPAKVRFFPFGTASDIFNSTKPLDQRKWDIAFVGSTSQYTYERRRAVLRAIRDHFGGKAAISLNAKVYVDRLAALYSNAKIVINCAADHLRTLNMRLFEGMGCGALVLTDWVPYQEKLFKDGKHYVVYREIDDLLGKLEYFLEHLDEAQRIAGAGYRHVMARHTYAHRAGELLTIIRKLGRKKRRGAKRRGPSQRRAAGDVGGS